MTRVSISLILLLILASMIFAQATDQPTASPTPTAIPSATPTPAPSNTPTPTPATSAVGQISIGSVKAAWKDLDLTDARISLAGPAALYIRNVGFDGKKYSLLAKQGSGTAWAITDVFDEANSTFPAQTFFDLATIELHGDHQLVIDGILLDGSPVKKTVEIKEDGSLIVPPTFESGAFVGKSLDRSKIVGKPGYDEQVTGLEKLNADSLAKIGSLETDKRSAKSELEAAKAEKDQAEAEQTRLLGENTALKAKMDELDTAMSDLKNRNSALTAETESLRTEIAGLKAGTTSTTTTTNPTNNPDLSGLQNRISDLDTKVKTLESRIASMEKELRAGTSNPTTTTTNSNDVDSLKAKIATLQAANETLMAERQTIEQKIRETFLQSGYVATLKPLLTKKVLAGFDGGKKDQGTWSIKNGILEQTDIRQYFARYTLPLNQKDQTLLYRFNLKATGKAWVGAGLHLYAKNSPLKGYGHGNSLLVWLTRDPAYYGNNRTYLQLYKSDDDIAMGRVLDAAIPDNIAEDMLVEILYQPKEEYVTIVVNGVEKIRYKTWFNVDEGIEIALRTLNSAQFSNLEVLTKP